MENRTPASVRVPADARRRDRRRVAAAAAAALLVHLAVLAALVLDPDVKEPPRIDLDESIPVELVLDLPTPGPRTVAQASDLPVTETRPAAPDKADAPADAPAPLAAAEPPPDAPAPPSLPPAAAMAAAAPMDAPPPPPPNAAPGVEAAAAPPPAAPDADPASVAPPQAIAMAAEPPAEGAAVPETPAPEVAETLLAAPAASTTSGPDIAVALAPLAAPIPDATSPAEAPAAATDLAALPAASLAPPVAEPSAPVVAAAAPPPAVDLPRPVEAPVPVTAPSVQAAVAAPPAVLAPSDPRDVVEDALKGLECARLSAEVDAAAGSVTVKGHARSEAERARLAAKLRTMPGVQRIDVSGVRILGEPYCRVLAFLDRPDFQKSAEQRQDLSSVGATNQPLFKRFVGGDSIDLSLGSPEFESYLYVDHFSGDGLVTHMLPSDRPDNRLPPDTPFRLGQGGDRGRRSVAKPPYGTDVIVVLASSEPLFLRPRPATEDAAVYLRAVDARLAELRAMRLRLKTEYAYILVTTVPPAALH